MQNITRWLLQGVLFSCLITTSSQATTDKDKLILGVHPYLSATEIQKRFQPLADWLTKVLSRPVEVRVGGNYAQHIEVIGKNQIDLAFLGPVGYVEVTEKYGNKPIMARFEVNHSPNLYGVIITRQDTQLSNLQQLHDKKFAFGDPESTMSHIVPRYMMLQAGLAQGAPQQYKFLGSHKNVALAVLSGDFAAGAVKKEVYDEFQSKGLRALATSPGIPDHIFIARSNLNKDLVNGIRQAMISLHQTPEGMAVLKKLHKHLTKLVPAEDAEYDELRTIVTKVNSLRSNDAE